ncbi:phospholipase D-like domain-containing protein [Alkalinema sp. FACHB-956]|uniref:phospholipase D-like domain-containing protein n=1 Tax=Alkalinema sp. FACHB-956 TaxID=2692768 RepID=UPI00168A136C|nr:phospholipase D-like domain-containing protein [Alkalinema sp. FACHB-956]MBD2330033.1 helix-hairpin-helix domain-containing protein [Alkalinema sp. FACHB-956]
MLSRTVARGLSAVLCIGFSLGLGACQKQSIAPVTVLKADSLPQDAKIQVYMNQNASTEFTDPYRSITRAGDSLEQQIIDTINQAKSTIDVAVQEFRLPNVAKALRDRAAAGIRIRVVLENQYFKPYSTYTAAEIAQLDDHEKPRYEEAKRFIDTNADGQLSENEMTDRDALVILDRANITRIDDTADGSKGSNLMHHKFMVVDGRWVITTSANWTTSDVLGDVGVPASRGNANNFLKIDSPELAKLFTEEFNILWGDGPGGKRDSRFGNRKPFRGARQVQVGDALVEVQFSATPRKVSWQQSTNGLIAKTLTQAKSSIAMALFVFSDQQLVNALEPVSQRGVQIQTLIEPGFAYRFYSDGLDMLGVTVHDTSRDRCRIDPTNRPWKQPIKTVGVPKMPPGDLLHHKFGVVDNNIVVMGSHNWTEAANRGNDETLLVIHSKTVAAHYKREFERLMQSVTLGVPPALQKKIAKQQDDCKHVKSSIDASGRVNVNTATVAELDQLPGIGKKSAERILAARQQRPLRGLQDLAQIPGMTPKKLQKLGDRVMF